MKKYFVFGDIHGSYNVFEKDLVSIGFDIKNPDHILLGVGDYFDRGNQSLEIYRFLTSMQRINRVYLVIGNHDAFFLDYLLGKDDGLFNIEYNGMWNTITSFVKSKVHQSKAYFFNEEYRDLINTNFQNLIPFLEKMPHGYKIGNLIFTHAGLDYDFISKTWKMNYWCQTPRFVAKFNKMQDHTFIFGHWHAKKLNAAFGLPETHQTFIYKNFIGLDACTNLSGFVNFYVFESDSDLIALDKDFRFE